MTDDVQIIRARFSKTVQTKPYESESAEIETTFNAVDAAAATEQDAALAACRAAVFKVLGLTTPDARAGADAPAVGQRAVAEGQAEMPTPRKAGRPTKAEAEAKRLAKEAADKALLTTNVDPMNDMVQGGDQPNISKGDSVERVPPTADPMADVVGADKGPAIDDMGIPVQAPKPVDGKKYTDMDLQNAAGVAVQKTGNSKLVRETVAKYADKVTNIKPEDRQRFIDELKSLSVQQKA